MSGSWTRFDDAMLAGCALCPPALGAAGALSAAPASHDEAVVRVVGLGWTGLFRGLDAIVAAPWMLVPIGTRAARAGCASALVAGACGAVAYVVARRLAFAVRPKAASPRLISAVAAVATLSALLAPVWQVEASAPGGTVLGPLLILIALLVAPSVAVAADVDVDVDVDADVDVNGNVNVDATVDVALKRLALILGLAASYEPLVFAGALAASLPSLHHAMRARRLSQPRLIAALPAFALGLAPIAFAWALSRRAPEIAISAARPLASSIGERAAPHMGIAAFATAEIGAVIGIATLAGVVLTALVPAARRSLASLLGVMLVGVIALYAQAATGPSHVAAAVLAATCALHLVASIALSAAVIAISTARVPFAEASAALVVVLELVLPVRAADETASRRAARSLAGSTVWNEVAWGSAPPAAVVLVSDPAIMRRIASSRATGQMRSDLLVVPTFALPSRATDRALVSEPKLAPLYRDVALGSTPEELSLATLATHRPLLASFDPKWDRNLARHFVPVGLTTRFEPEPRGASDRKKGLEAFTAGKDRLVRVAVARRDADLAAVTATLLRGRAIGMAACGEREVLSRALDDLRPFAPDDPVANTLVRRIVTSKGPIEVRDLVP